jgi:hypothetical protein
VKGFSVAQQALIFLTEHAKRVDHVVYADARFKADWLADWLPCHDNDGEPTTLVYGDPDCPDEPATDATSELLEAALAYAASGWRIFPCRPTKAPYTAHGFKDATTNPDKIKDWWRQWPDAMIGARMGIEGVFAVDLDRKPGGGDGVAAWTEIQEQHGGAPETLVHETPSTGRHLFFRTSLVVRSVALNRIAPGMEVKGDGGYVILPPSRRADGEAYRVVAKREIAQAPEWLLERINEAGRRTAKPRPMTTTSPDLGVFEDDEDAGRGVSQRPEDLLDERARIKAALAVIDSDDYQVWFRVGAGLWDAVRERMLSEHEARDAFYEWSAKSPKYKKWECERKWDDCARLEQIGAGTIFHYARESDPNWWRQIERPIAPDNPDDDALPDEDADEGEVVEQANVVEQGDAAQVQSNPGESADKPKNKGSKPILSSSEFVSGFKPPDYLVAGLLQRRFIYSLTAPTGAGKTCVALRIEAHVAEGLQIGNMEVERGKVLFFAGENPDDVRMRWIKLCEEMGLDPDEVDVYFIGGPRVLTDDMVRSAIMSASIACGPFSLVVVDTSAAFFTGENENDNVEMLKHAKMLRRLTKDIHGGPTVLVTSHPVKNFSPENLLPRGGGAFLNEVDGNLVCIKNESTMTVEVTTHGKFRGPDFAPFSFGIKAGTTERLKDSKGRLIWTVTAEPISAEQAEATRDRGRENMDKLLVAMADAPRATLEKLARKAGWFYKNGAPYKSLAQRTMTELVKAKYVKKIGNRYELTKTGKAEAQRLEEEI